MNIPAEVARDRLSAACELLEQFVDRSDHRLLIDAHRFRGLTESYVQSCRGNM